MQVGTSFITVDADISQHAVHYYENLFKEDHSLLQDYSILDNFNWNKVLDMQNLLLTSIPSDEEIRDVVFRLDASSAPGLDGSEGISITIIGTLFRVTSLRQSLFFSPLLRSLMT